MDIVSLLANQAGPSSTGPQAPSQGQALTDFAQVMARVADSLKNAPGTSGPPGAAADSGALSLPGSQADLTGKTPSSLAGLGELPESLSELAEALRNDLRRAASYATAREHNTGPVEDLQESTLPETGELPAVEQLAALAAAAAALTTAEAGSGNGKSGSQSATGAIQPAANPLTATRGAAASPGEFESSDSMQLLAATHTSGHQPGKATLAASVLVASGLPAPATDPAAAASKAASGGQSLLNAANSEIPISDLDGQLATAAASGRESSPWTAELSARALVEAVDGKAQAAGSGPGNAVDTPALSGPQQANVSSPVTTAAQATLSQNLSAPGWPQQFSQQVLQFAQRGDRQVELRLNPAELGPLSVSLRVDEQGAQAHFLSAHASVRAAVEQAIPQLRETLAEQGITLAEAQVGEQGFGRSREQQGQDSGGRERSDQLAGSSEPATTLEASVSPVDTGLPGAVNTWA